MAKRFIDTGMFDDPWFMNLSISGKILWIYCITKCDHAGILEWNKKLAQFQTGIKSIDTVIKELGNRLLRVSEQYIFIPKFIEFQYPNFPQSAVRQQASAIKRLVEFGLYNKEKQTVSKELPNSYEHEHGIDNGNEIVTEHEVEKNHIPHLDEFLAYAIKNKPDVNKEVVNLKYKSWVENGWKDGNNKQIKNWKSKLLNTLPHMAIINNGRENTAKSVKSTLWKADD